MAQHAVAEAAAGEELEDDEGVSVQVAGVEDADDVGVAEGDERADLAGETVEEVGAAEVGVRGEGELEDDVDEQSMVVGLIDPAHAALANDLEDFVASIPDPSPWLDLVTCAHGRILFEG
jgi:hypothetical protein